MDEFEQWYEKSHDHLKNLDAISDAVRDLIKSVAHHAWEVAERETKIKMIEEGWRKDDL